MLASVAELKALLMLVSYLRYVPGMDDYGDLDENPLTGEDAFLPNWYVANDDELGPPVDNVVHEGVHSLDISDLVPAGNSFHTEKDESTAYGRSAARCFR